MDAKRLSDGAIVAIKKVLAETREVTIARMLSEPENLRDPTNHCVPIFDYFIDEEEDDMGYLVMPVLRRFNDPPFFYVDEVVDFIKQTLEVCFQFYLFKGSWVELLLGSSLSSQLWCCPQVIY